jgi:hypothetical protein
MTGAKSSTSIWLRSVTLRAIKTRSSPGWKKERVQFEQMRHEPAALI